VSGASKPKDVEVNESVVSMLIKLHNKLSDKDGSYVPLSIRGGTIDPYNLVGGGPFFVGRLLDTLSVKGAKYSEAVELCYKDLLPHTTSDSGNQSLK
jgi:hypothetical protein